MIWRDIETDGVIRLWTYANDVKDGPEYWFSEPCIDVTTNSKGETFVVNRYNCDLFISNINKNVKKILILKITILSLNILLQKIKHLDHHL